MELNQFFVSVIIPVYNGEKFLAEAIENVQQQGHYPLEIIVVDDGSTDGTADIAAQFKDEIRYVYQSNKGPAVARNLGITLASGNVIAFLDTDDLWSNDKLKLQLTYLAEHPSVEIVQGSIQQMQLSTWTREGKAIFKEVHSPYSYINIGSAIYRKLVFDKVGLFDETMSYGEDVDWFFRAWENGVSKVVLDQVNLYYRKHQANMTSGKNLVEVGFVRIFKKHLDRCRKNGKLAATLSPSMLSISEYIGMPPESYKV
ncbi:MULTISPECIES: glycosyltransferase family 2 protein [unclassified Coleofasciculus]|uniref:glycosyltransferase family 2 protein n=1 Tax=unclassified Coleofasciculus TaxID=2692782 RepID=UPI00188150EA|nr:MULTISPECIES: glycosyltransferase family A protein [unclassified Coleofasciculus]MBE9125523.1 glycosyltransferase family 2 protein [Coleofasciculus sp. LEGE 07081]MBE9148613.1 glycosyltransferase family 2 protein [Coleofasciculus sp. LEGE 07092]